MQFIEDFWEEEIALSTESPIMNLLEQASYNKLIILLVNAIWDETKNEVSVQDIWRNEIPKYTFNNFADFKTYLKNISDEDATRNFPNYDTEKETYESLYNGQKLVDLILNDYKKDLIILGWI